MKKWLGCAALAAVFAVPATAAAGELRLSIANGRVTLVAQDVTIKQILDEWSRVGQTKVVGAERLPGTPISIELQNVAESRALESLLRAASGYIAKPRVVAAGMSASTYDAILIMPASRAPAVSNAPPPFNARPQPQMVMPNIVDDDVETPSPIMPPGSVPAPPQQYPGQPPAQPGQQPQTTLPRPGMLPQAPTIPGNPYTNPQQPIRPPGMPSVPGPGGAQNPGGGPGGSDA